MTNITNIAVLGAGNLGAQIAMFAAYHGKDVVSYDINDDALKAAQGRFDAIGKKYLEDLSDATEEKVAEGRARLTQSADLAEAVKNADLVIEAIPENPQLKHDTFQKLSTMLQDHAIIATNSSTLRPSDFAEDTGRPDKFLAMHFANNIHVMNVVEVMMTPKTSPETFQTCLEASPEIGMRPVPLKKEQPGYVINTLLVPWLNSGTLLWTRGVADVATVEAVASVITGGHLFTPFHLFDIVGFGVAYNISLMHPEDPTQVEMAKRLKWGMDHGYLGVETGKGFYNYDENGQATGLTELATREWETEVD